jgi:hypothetical protein
VFADNTNIVNIYGNTTLCDKNIRPKAAVRNFSAHREVKYQQLSDWPALLPVISQLA